MTCIIVYNKSFNYSIRYEHGNDNSYAFTERIMTDTHRLTPESLVCHSFNIPMEEQPIPD